MSEKFSGAASQRVQGLACRASFNPLITSVNLSPGFLNYQDPDLIG